MAMNFFNQAIFDFNAYRNQIRGQSIVYFHKSDDTSGYTQYPLTVSFGQHKPWAMVDGASAIQLKNTYINVDGRDLPITPDKGDYITCKGITFDLVKSDINDKFFNNTMQTVGQAGLLKVFLIQRTKSIH